MDADLRKTAEVRDLNETMYKEFDVATWNRRTLFEFFSTYDDPFFGISTYLDITSLYNYCRQNDHSINLAILYYSTLAINSITEFRLRLKDGIVVLYDRIDCGTTVFHDDKSFSFCYIEFKPTFQEFEIAGRELIKRQLESKQLDPRDDVLSMVHCSTIPWTSFTSIKYAKKFGTSDSIPKITFGKYFSDNSRRKLPISIEVNHALLDGYHVGMYLSKFQEVMDKLS